MTLRTLLERLLDDRPPTQEADTWRGIQARLERSPKRRIFITVVAAAAIALVLSWLRTASVPPEHELYLYVARSDRPASEALELSLKESP